MSERKKQIRKLFNEVCLERDKHTCRVCHRKDLGLDVHHICDRVEMPSGGYVKENGISLCPECHEKAERFHVTSGKEWVHGMHPDDLYRKIGSSHEKAAEASLKLT